MNVVTYDYLFGRFKTFPRWTQGNPQEAKTKTKIKHFGQTNLSQNLPKLFYISNFLLLLASLLKLFESQVVLLMHLFYNKIKGSQENNFIINILNLCFDPSGSWDTVIGLKKNRKRNFLVSKKMFQFTPFHFIHCFWLLCFQLWVKMLRQSKNWAKTWPMLVTVNVWLYERAVKF